MRISASAQEQVRYGIEEAAVAQETGWHADSSPHTCATVVLVFDQIVGMASPFAVMKVEGNTEQSVYKVRRVFALPTDQHLAHKLLRASGNDRPQLSSSR